MLPGPTIIKKCSVCFKSIEQDTLHSGNTFGATLWTDGKNDCPMLPDQQRLVICPHCRSPLWIDEMEELGQIDRWGYASMDRLSGDKPFDDPGKFIDAQMFEIPSLADFFELLEKGIDEPEKETYVRLHAWWAGNDKRRIRIRIEQDDELGWFSAIVFKITALLFKTRPTRTIANGTKASVNCGIKQTCDDQIDMGQNANAGEIPLSAREIANLTVFSQSLDESNSEDLVMKAEVMRELGRFDDALSLLAKSTDEKLARVVETIRRLSEMRDPYVREFHPN